MTVYVHLSEHDQAAKQMQQDMGGGGSPLLGALLIGRKAMTSRLAQMQADMDNPGAAIERDHGDIAMPKDSSRKVVRRDNTSGGQVQMTGAQNHESVAPNQVQPLRRKAPQYGQKL